MEAGMTGRLLGLGPKELGEISRLAVSMESNRRPTVFKWPGRRPIALVRFLLALAAGSHYEEALAAAKGEVDSLARIASRARGLRLLDPFSGSGLIPVEASKLGYNAVGQDVNPYSVMVSRAYATLCNGTCMQALSCIYSGLRRAWDESKRLWCRGDECVIHVLLARCPPCRAPMWVSSKRRNGVAFEALVLGDNGIERSGLEGLSPREPLVDLPPELPEAAPGYAAYAVEVWKGGSRHWISLIHDEDWRAFIAETARTARIMVAGMGAPIPVMEETIRLHRMGLRSTAELFTWRQLVTYKAFLEATRDCVMVSAPLASTTYPATSLLALYYQPLAKVNPGLTVKSYWIPANPVELNPLAHRGMPGPPVPGARGLGRGTLVSTVERYRRACGVEECRGRLEFYVGDSTLGVPPGRYDLIFTDPPYPGHHTYRDLTLFYAHSLALAGYDPPLEWGEIDTRDRESYVNAVLSSVRRAGSRMPRGSPVILLLSASTPEGVASLAMLLREAGRAGLGVKRVYPVIGELPGKLGRARSRLTLVVVSEWGTRPDPGAYEPLLWAGEVARRAGLSAEEVEAADLVATSLAAGLGQRLNV